MRYPTGETALATRDCPSKWWLSLQTHLPISVGGHSREANVGAVTETSFEPIAETYLSARNRWIQTYYERPSITADLPSVGGRTVLDLGCATGYFAEYCLDRGAEVIAVDASEKMVGHTLRVFGGKVRGFVHDIAQPFTFIGDNEVDVIICSLVLHYLENWDDTLGEFHRMLRRGGRCIISTHHPMNDYRKFNQDDYFAKRLVEDEWKKRFPRPVRVKYYVRPLSEYIQPLLACKLRLLKISEPQPSPELVMIDKDTFDGLRTHPVFLFFLLEKDR